MNSEQRKKVEQLFQQARSLDAAERAKLLERACAAGDILREELESLLARLNQAGATGSPFDGSTDTQRDSASSDATLELPPALETRPKGSATKGVIAGSQVHPSEDRSEDDAKIPIISKQLIEGYTILRELHRGGQGIVYQAVQESTKRKVAIKLLLEGPYASKSARRRFEREVQLIAQLRHPHIVEVFQSGVTSDDRQYCVMDYVRGVPLNRYVRENNLTLDDTLRLFVKVCDAVHYAHMRGVIHRDLKPSNILVESNGNPKVLDFGLAKQFLELEATLVSVSGQVVGTLPYMSPEQTKGNPDEIDMRTDIYSLGVMLYESLTGQFPYPVTGQIADVLKHIAHTLPVPLSRAWSKDSGIRQGTGSRLRTGACPIDSEVQTIILRAIAKERERRYQSAAELLRDLQRYLDGETIEAKRDSRLYVLKKALLRHRMGSLLVALLVIVSVVFVTALMRARTGEDAQRHYDYALHSWRSGEYAAADANFLAAERLSPRLEGDFYKNFASFMRQKYSLSGSKEDRNRMRHYIALAESRGEIDAELLNIKGVDLRMDKRYDEAIEAHLHATRLDPNYFPNWVSMANAHIERGELSSAETALLRATETSDGRHNQVVWHNLLAVRLQLRSSDIRETLQEMPAFQSVDKRVTILKGLAMSRSDDIQQRREALAVIKSASDKEVDARTLGALAMVSLRAEDWHQAEMAANKAEGAGSLKSLCASIRAIALARQGKKEAAVRELDAARRDWPARLSKSKYELHVTSGYIWIDSIVDLEELAKDAETAIGNEGSVGS